MRPWRRALSPLLQPGRLATTAWANGGRLANNVSRLPHGDTFVVARLLGKLDPWLRRIANAGRTAPNKPGVHAAGKPSQWGVHLPDTGLAPSPPSGWMWPHKGDAVVAADRAPAAALPLDVAARLVFDHLPIPICVLDGDCRLVAVNPRPSTSGVRTSRMWPVRLRQVCLACARRRTLSARATRCRKRCRVWPTVFPAASRAATASPTGLTSRAFAK